MKETVESTQVRDVYAIVTNRIINLLEQGVVPWRKTWTSAGQPQNLITKIPYHGINVLLLNSLGYSSNSFLTFKQIGSLGAKVRKGEKGTAIVFWKWIEKDKDGTEEKERKPLLKYYFVFNVSQCENIPLEMLPIVTKPLEPIHECEVIVQNMPNRPVIKTSVEDPFYSSKEDYINMRDINDFAANEDYYSVLFHEMIHATGHTSRLNRREVMNNSKYRSELYSLEELTAEIGACFLKSHVGFSDSTYENSAAYIQGWLSKLKSDKRFIVYAAAQAQRAAEFILDVKVATGEE